MNIFADYKKIAGITNYFRVEFLKISFYLILFVVKMDNTKEFKSSSIYFI